MRLGRFDGRRFVPTSILVILLLLLCRVAPAQQAGSSGITGDRDSADKPALAPARADASGIIKAPPPTKPTVSHAFWDRKNILLFSGVAAMRGLDYASTRNFEARGRQEILLPQDVVDNSAGFASIEAAGTATSVGISYWLHRTGHHSLERWFSLVHIGATAFGDARNYALKSRHRQ
jgi:hypothetical protein